MKKSSDLAQAKTDTGSHTYKWEGKVLTQEQMLKIMTICPQKGGMKQFVLYERPDLPPGTLINKRDLLVPVMSIESEMEQDEKRRRQEGHRFAPTQYMHPDSLNIHRFKSEQHLSS